MSEDMKKFDSTFEYKVIYVFRINDKEHEGCLKIGDATLKTKKNYDEFPPFCHELNAAARKRIDEYTVTAGIKYDLIYTEIAVYLDKDKNVLKAFRDHKVHNVLRRSGVKNVYFDTAHKQNEWFICDLETAKNAIKSVKEDKNALDGCEITQNQNPIILRPEQEKAITLTMKRFTTSHHMLWNAKMRFGKTLSTLELVKRMKFQKTIIITHRPDVDSGWFEDFSKIFYEKDTQYSYGSKRNGKTIDELIRSNKPFVYFASIQDLRGSEKAGGKFDKNDEVFGINWDLVVTDEAHEGTQTELGKNVRELLIKEDTYDLSLSGTPFNLFDQYADENTYTWDYIMEQQAKYEWMRSADKLGDSNPYEELPKLNIFTYQLDQLIKTDFDLEDKAFNFKEFFRTWTGDKEKDFCELPSNAKVGNFVHEDAVKAFLDLLCLKSETSNYSFSTDEYRDFFRHTLWMIPGVKEGKALTELLKNHPVFSNFNIVNVAGDEDYDYKEEQKARDKLSKAMTNHPEDTRTITLSCGRLTTGVTVPEWTAVLMLYGTYMTDAKTYLQTIFRVQSPGNINGKIKENCYVFDFAPDRTLRVVYDSVQKMAKKREPKIEVSKLMGEFLNFCPVISLSEVSYMKTFSANELLQEVKRVYAERVVESGFEDRCLYDELKLKQLDKDALDKFEVLRKIIGKTNQTKKTDVSVNENDLTEEQRKELEELNKKKKDKNKLSEEEKKRLNELKELQDKKRTAISILRGISIRIPLLVYGMDIDYSADVTIDGFADLIDETSWVEFMPAGVTKEVFKQFVEYYDKDIFIRSCRSIRAIAKQCDELEPTERIKKLVELFSKFKNPDKETVLTPWRVVNMHMAQTIGGYSFFNDDFSQEIDSPKFIEVENVTSNIFKNDGKVLEINSKTGLYPLYVTYTFYREKIKGKEDTLSFEDKKKIWDDVVENNIFVICKTDMAKQITKRTLLGYTKGKMNAHAFDDLVNQMKEKQQQLVEKIIRPSFWNKGGKEMKFNAVVGNPPYQFMDGGAQASATPAYNYFVEVAKKIEPEFISMIMPSRWMTAGKGLDDFRMNMIHDKRIAVLHDYMNASECFANVDIKGGICYFLWDKKNVKEASIFTHYDAFTVLKSKRYLAETDEDTFFIRDAKLVGIMNKVRNKTVSTFDNMVSSRKPYGITADFFKNPKKYGLPPISDEKIEDGYKILGLGEKMKRTYKYISKDYPLPKTDGLNEYKIFIPESYGAGLIGEKITSPVIAKPGELCTETFLQIRPVESEIIAENIIKYLNTKFFRALVGTLKNTQHGTSKVYSLVPILDFTKAWSDEDLYKKFNLSKEEQEYLENLIKD